MLKHTFSHTKILHIVIVSLLLISIGFSWMLVSGFTIPQETLSPMEKLSAKLLSSVPSELSEEEKRAYVRTDTCGEKDEYQILYNVDDDPEYVLVEHHDGGYSIYNRLTGTLLERNPFGAAPFSADGHNVYGGPTLYCEKTDKGLFDLHEQSVLSDDEVRSVRFTQDHARQTLVEKAVSVDKITPSASVASTPVWDFSESFPFDDVNLSNFTNVTHDAAIASWTSAQQFGLNVMGTCQAVAATILLRYEDIQYSGVIPTVAPQSWHNAADSKVYRLTDFSGNDINTSFAIDDLRDTPEAGKTYNLRYENVHRFITAKTGVTDFRNNSHGNGGIADSEIVSALQAYVQQVNALGCLNISVNVTHYYLWSSQQEVFNDVKTIVNNDHPFAISMKWETPENSSSSSDPTGKDHHKVVSYGYYEDEEDGENYVRVHFGWGTSIGDVESNMFYSSVIINQAYLNSASPTNFYLTTTVNSTKHVLTENDNHTHSCANPNCYAQNVEHECVFKNGVSKHSCVCGATYEHEEYGGERAIIIQASKGIFNYDYDKSYFEVPEQEYCIPAFDSSPALLHRCYCGEGQSHQYNTDNHSIHMCEKCTYGSYPMLEHSFVQRSDKKSHYCSLLCGISEPCYALNNFYGEFDQYYENGVLSLNYHTQKCFYCKKEALFAHAKTYTINEGGTHTLRCAYCNLEHTAAHSYTVRQYSSTQHVTKCNCGDGAVYASHSFKSYLLIYKKCTVCGYKTLK
ncbi:MAG: hypothetical protein IJ735_01170 [Clostridia bacterium]|nr:hypothetical protein [Clostridia bacterium]